MPQNITVDEENIYSFVYRENYHHKDTCIQKWWDSFSSFNTLIDEYFSSPDKGNFDLPAWMVENLQAIDKNLMWEFYSGINKKHRLVITCEERRDLRPLVKKILDNAPQLEKWEFYAYRLPEDINEVTNIIKETRGWDDITDISSVRFTISKNKLNRIDVVYHLPFLKSKETIFEYLFLLTTLILGEEIVDKWIGNIDVKILDNRNLEIGGYENIFKLNIAVNNEINNIKNSLPIYPYFLEEHSWNIVKFTPEKQEECAERKDIMLYSIISIDLLDALLDRYFFDSERFSRHNEIFVYLKIAREVIDSDHEELKFIHETLDYHLKQASLGCVVGRAIGLKYLYVDLAIVNKIASIKAVKKALSPYKFGNVSQLLFHDAELANDCLKISDD